MFNIVGPSRIENQKLEHISCLSCKELLKALDEMINGFN